MVQNQPITVVLIITPIPMPCSIADELLTSNRSEAIAKTTLGQKIKYPHI